MTDNELLQAISTMIDQKLDPIKSDIADMKSEIADMKSEIVDIKKDMVTKEDLKNSENMILNEVDRVQEKTNEKFNNLKFRVM